MTARVFTRIMPPQPRPHFLAFAQLTAAFDLPYLPRMTIPRVLSLGLAVAAIAHLTPRALAQTKAFNDTFTGASTSNANPSSPLAPTVTAASYQQLSAKSFSPNPPVITAGNLRFGIVGTTSGFNHLQALFTQYPVTLVNTGDYIELTVNFTSEGGIITAQTNSTLFFGLHNAGQVQPIPGGMNGTVATATAGYAQTWQGYVSRIFYAGGSNGFYTRPAQSAGAANNQDVLYNYTGASSVGSKLTSTLAALTAGSPYTEVFRITKASATTLTLASSLYAGTTPTGTPLYAQEATSSSILTAVFDAFAIGWRATGGVVSVMDISAIKITTTGTTTIIPEITSQPFSITKSVGESTTFTVVADGGPGTALTYQWQKNGVPIPDATSASYTIASAALGDSGDYTVVVSDVAGSTTSSVATLTVTTEPVPPSIIVQPTGGTIVVGGSFTFSATVNGTSPLAYQWQHSTDGGANFTDIGGATSAGYTLSNAALSDAGLYQLVVTNSVGSATTTPVALVVNAAPTITDQPVGGAINPGESITLSVTATGTPAPTYQWLKNGAAIAGATSSSYTINPATGADTANYKVVVTNSVGSVTSAAASVAVVSPTMAASATTPSAIGTCNLDTRLTLTFNDTPTAGVSGFVRIYDASNDTVVDTIDLVAATTLRDTLRASGTLSTQLLPVQTKTIGGITNFNYYPITISGNTATIYPRNGVLAYGKTYYVKVDAGAFVNSAGEAFAGIGDPGTWRFTTKANGPAGGATSVTVAADGSGDFDTVQAALDFIPSNNTTPTVISVKSGSYFEQVAFQSKHYVTLLGENVDQTIVAYPNNNNFNNASGVYHRGTFLAQSVHDFTLANLTVNNTTPQNGTQAEALILNGSSAIAGHNLVTHCKFFSYQDTVQFNKQTYVSDSTIVGDVDFMWGDGPTFLENCDIRILRTGGYFTQIRNGSGNHGYVFFNCRFTAPAGIAGTFLGRIDPAAFPFSEVVVLDSTFGDVTNTAFLATTTGVSGSNYLAGWWLLNNASGAGAASNVHNWSNSLLNATGGALANPNADAFTTMPVDATTQANYRNATWVLNSNIAGTVNGSWSPSLAPVIVAPPAPQVVDVGQPATFTVTAFAVPEPTYQWKKDGNDIPGATGSSFTIASATAADADTYSVVVSNSAGTVTSSAVTLLVNGGPPVITLQPVSQSAFAGTGVGFSVFAVGDGPFGYQWSKDGSPINGATNPSLLLSNVQAADAGSYTVTVSNASGADTSHAATLKIATPAAGFTPTLPTIPTTVFNAADYGAVGDGVTNNSAAFAAAITAAKNAGGGIVELPPAAGAYLSGPIALSSNINFQVDGGATLKMLPYGTYPSITTHFITVASGSSNVAITGNGTIDGDGAAWWAAYDGGVIATRPRLIQFTKATQVLVAGVTLRNSPSFNLAFSGVNSDVTIFGVSITAPGDSPNTDGMDLAGTNFLVQNCYVSVGDDNVVAKPGSAFCQHIVVADCAFGTGHGVSIGGQTNVGLDGMLVTNCTFNGTSSALRFKADPTQGGPVQNVTFENITMTNVQYPILFYSYYNQLGSPGAVSGSSQTTPAKVNAWNATPPNSLASSTIPMWKNITVTNLTVINGSGYSTIWGLPLADALIQNVTLNNVNIQGGAGLELYDATNIQLTGTNNVGPIITCNALAITGQPASRTVTVGDSVTFSATAVGGSGTNNAGLTYRWNLDGAPLTDGLQSDGSTLAGATTAALTITNVRAARAGNYALTVSTTLDGYDTSTGSLAANSLPVSATSSAAALTVNPLPATISLSGLTYTYDGAAKSALATTDPVGLAVELTYDGSSTPPTDAGSYSVLATITDPDYVGSTSGTLSIAKATPILGWSAPAAITYGTALSATQLNATANTAGEFAYSPPAGTVLAAGADQPLSAIFTPADTANFNGGNVATTITVNPATANLVLGHLTQTYDGSPKSITVVTIPADLAVDVTYAGSATPPTGAGSYAVVATVNDANYVGSASGTLVITKAAATISLAPLSQPYDGTPRTVTATTIPSGLTVNIAYDAGSSVAPVYPGEHAVVATIDDPDYEGDQTDTLVVTITALVRHAPKLYGDLDGSLQVLLPESVTVHDGAMIFSDLLVPGMPSLRLNGHPLLAGTIDGPGAATPTNHVVTLSGSATLRYLVRRIDAIVLPTVAAPPAPNGTRDVTIKSSSQSVGNFATLRNLTLSGSAGAISVPPGTYGAFTAKGSTSFVLGVAGATEPAIYNLQSLTLSGSGSLQVVGPVVLTLANDAVISGTAGDAAHPERLVLNVAAGDVTLNTGAVLNALTNVPSGTVSLGDGATLHGRVASDRLTLNATAVIDEQAP